jgi:hypothetical protein
MIELLCEIFQQRGQEYLALEFLDQEGAAWFAEAEKDDGT